ncbi:MAG: hypothetical protein WAL71_13815 [Terriglobales bacterium]|jgi:hypothetical protein
MNYSITKRLPCSVCGLDSLSREGWFLATENRWLDRLKIFTWHRSLASQHGFKSACGREHLSVLVAYWLDHGGLRLPQAYDPVPITSDPLSEAVDPGPAAAGRLVGELSVYREALTRGWTGSQTTLQAIIDALIPSDDVDSVATHGLHLFRPPQEPPYGLSLH